MVQGRDGVLRPLQDPETLLESIPELHTLAQIKLEIVCNIDSSNVTPRHWSILGDTIMGKKNACDGFVILHGTDTMAYTASALSFLLAELTVPVIITGAQRPLCLPRTDARANIINAVELATRNIPEVAVLFNNRLLRGNRTRKTSNDHYNAFHSPNYPPLAQLGLRIDLDSGLFWRKKRKILAKKKFVPEVFCLRLFPGLNPQIYSLIRPQTFKAIIVQGFGAGNIPLTNSYLLAWIEGQMQGGTIIAISSQSPRGYVDLSLYEGGKRAKSSGAVPCQDMTIETSLIKMMLLLGEYDDRATIEKMFTTSLAGELTTRKGST